MPQDELDENAHVSCVSGTFVRTAAVIGLPLARLRAAIPEEILGGPPAHHVTGRRVLSAVWLKDKDNHAEVQIALSFAYIVITDLSALPAVLFLTSQFADNSYRLEQVSAAYAASWGRRHSSVIAEQSVKAKAAGQFEVLGQLSIKGVSKEVSVPVSLSQTNSPQGLLSLAKGEFQIKRVDFKIGDGEWGDTSIVANEVVVKFSLALLGVPPL